MAIQFACSCGRKLQADEAHVGRRVRCPACGTEMTVPGDESAVQPVGAVPSKPAAVQAEEPPPSTDDERPRRRPRKDDDDEGEERPRRRRRRFDDEDDREDDEEERRPAGRKTSGKATAALVLGIVAVLLGCVAIGALAGAVGIILGVLSLVDIGHSRGRLGGKGLAIVGMILAVVGIAEAPVSVIFGIQKVRQSAERLQSSNNLKIMSLAMINDADSNQGRMVPAAICDKEGRPLLSWRVAILPYIEQDALYHRFKLDEPWDGPNNRQLIALMPKTYAHPGDPTASAQGLTHYRIFTGPQTPFPAAQPPFPPGRSPMHFPAGFADGTSNTILIVEAADAVPWTKPAELPYDPNKPLPKLGLIPGRPFNVGLADGSVRSLSPSLSDKTLRAAITPNGNDLLGPDW